MNCIINQTVKDALEKGKKFDVVSRYIRLKYRIKIDAASIKQRAKALRVKNFELT
jgi:tRNA(Ser,Leu) C12 N-acetylase TAN1